MTKMLELKTVSIESPEFEELRNKNFFQNSELSEVIDRVSKMNDIILYAAYDNEDKVVRGFAIVDSATSNVISLLSLSVDPDYRGHGVGTKLIDYIISDKKPKAVVAEALDDSVGFFENYGFYSSDLGESLSGTNAYYLTYRCK